MDTFFPMHIAGEILAGASLTAGVFWLAIARSVDAGGFAASQGRRIKLGLAIALGAWFTALLLLARPGTFRLDRGLLLPNLVVAILIPVAIGTLALASARVRAIVDRIPQSWLAGIHGVRILFGFVFIAFYELGALPARFAFQVGYGDVLAGLLGVTAAYLVLARHRLAFPSLFAWNIVGLVDFLTAVPAGIALIPADAPIQGFYPFFLIPGFVVPILLLLHIASMRGLIVSASRWRSVATPAPIAR